MSSRWRYKRCSNSPSSRYETAWRALRIDEQRVAATCARLSDSRTIPQDLRSILNVRAQTRRIETAYDEGASMSALQVPDIVLTKSCQRRMYEQRIAIGDVLGTLNKPKRIRKANPTELTDSVWRAETNGVGAYYRWSSAAGKWIILSCWRYAPERLRVHHA